MKKLITLAAIIVSFLVSCKQEVYYSVTTKVQPDGAGNIVVSPSSDLIQEGASVTFTAKSNGEYMFTGWSGSLSGTDNPKTVTASSNLNVVANFTLRSYPLTLTVEGEGSVTEKVISTKADYTSGTIVELTATPATGWSFSHWEGDMTGTDNPAQITISGAESVKAVFTKNKYTYNLKMVGAGAVDEYLVENTKGTFDYGTRLILKAHPDKWAEFVGWSGDYTGNELELELPLDSNKSIVATFAKTKAKTYQLPDLKQPWCDIKCLYSEIDYL